MVIYRSADGLLLRNKLQKAVM